jgi:hypothetical protein
MGQGVRIRESGAGKRGTVPLVETRKNGTKNQEQVSCTKIGTAEIGDCPPFPGEWEKRNNRSQHEKRGLLKKGAWPLFRDGSGSCVGEDGEV